jgi:Domain of unknown function (DUF4267)
VDDEQGGQGCRRRTFQVAFALGGGFVVLGALFVIAPQAGAALFGIPAPTEPAEAYVRAIGFRDIAFGISIAALALRSSPGALSILLGAMVIIPLCDCALLLIALGLSSPWQLALHAASAGCLAVMAIASRE